MSDTLFSNVDDLLNASMDDLDDLPPIGVPPTGHYNLTVSFDIKEVGEGESKKEVIAASYLVDAVNELKDPDEADDVKPGQQFSEFFHLTKKDGTRNTFGIGTLKERLKPFVPVYNTSNIGELVKSVKQVAIAAEVIRKVNKKNEDQYNMNMKNMIVL